MTVAAAAAAWLGGSLVLLSDGRRGVGAGLALLAAGLAGLALSTGDPVAAAALLAGGLIAGALRFRSGPAGWAVMPAGSTPRLILTIVAALLALYIAAVVTTGGAPGLRFAVPAVIAVLTLRLLLGADAAAAAAVASGLALILGAGALVATAGAPTAACIVAAFVAAALQAVPRLEQAHGA